MEDSCIDTVTIDSYLDKVESAMNEMNSNLSTLYNRIKGNSQSIDDSTKRTVFSSYKS